MQASPTLYEKDFYAWTQEQANFIKAKDFNKLDFVHLQEELQIMGASEKRELESRLEKLLMHLLKWKYQPTYINKKSWERTIKEQRIKLGRHLKDNPSLTNQSTFDERFKEAYETAILRAAEETGLDEDIFPNNCEWTAKQILDNEFYPN
jgi:hypothetical protein